MPMRRSSEMRARPVSSGGVLIQPMIKGVAEAYAGIIDDPLFGPAICFGLGGVFVEILNDTVTEMAPLTHDGALAMIHRIKGAPLLQGARGRDRADVEALAALLVALGQFAIANSGTVPGPRPQSHHRRQERRGRRRYRHRAHHGGRR